MCTRLGLSLWFIWILCFHFAALTELGAFMQTEVYVLRVAPGPRVKLASHKSALNTPAGLFYWRSKAVVLALVLLFVA